MSSVKKICVCALCAALCCVLPLAFHAVGLGTALSPMHLPVLLCGLMCGWPYGALCGLVGPVLSSVVSGMPGAPQLLTMVPELMVYGLAAGALMAWVRTGRHLADLYLSLVPAMVLGRVAGGCVQALVYLSRAEGYSLALWAGSYVVGTLPGAVVQLIVLPALVLVLTRARLLPARYPGQDTPAALREKQA